MLRNSHAVGDRVGALPIKMLGGNEFRLRKVACLWQATLTARTGAEPPSAENQRLPTRSATAWEPFRLNVLGRMNRPARSWRLCRQLPPREPARTPPLAAKLYEAFGANTKSRTALPSVILTALCLRSRSFAEELVVYGADGHIADSPNAPMERLGTPSD